MDEDDICYECSGYGNDYFINDDGELECFCPYCEIYRRKMEDEPQFSAVRKNDYCSMGAKKEVLKDEFHQHNEVT